MYDRHSGCNHPRSARWRSKVRCWEHYLLIISHVSSHMLSFNFTRVPKDKIGFSQSTNTSQGEARGDKVSSYLSLLFIFNPRFTKRHFVRVKNTQAFRVFYLLQFVTLVTNIHWILRLRQRLQLYFKNFKLEVYLLIFFLFFSQFISKLSQIFHHESRN